MGRLIVLDGLDGSGKSTQLDRLNAYFKQTQRKRLKSEWGVAGR